MFKSFEYLIQAISQFVKRILMQTFRLPNVMFAKGRFGNVVSDDSFHSDACFSFLSNILSICIATKRKNIGAGLGGAQPPFLTNIMFYPSPYPSPSRGEGTMKYSLYKSQRLKDFESFFEYHCAQHCNRLFTIHNSRN